MLNVTFRGLLRNPEIGLCFISNKTKISKTVVFAILVECHMVKVSQSLPMYTLKAFVFP